MSYTPPPNFREFIERYPTKVKRRINRKWGGLRFIGPEDLLHDVYVHLMSLPDKSSYRDRGCVDRISTFDPAKVGGCTEGLFLAYIFRIVDRCVLSRIKYIRNRMISATDTSIDDISSRETAVELLIGKFHFPDPDSGLRFEEICRAAGSIHPRLEQAARLLSITDEKKEAFEAMGLSEHTFRKLERYLRMIVDGDLDAARTFKARRAYSPRKNKL